MPEQDKPFDAFLSYNSKDRPAVRRLAERLRAQGLRVWLDVDELTPGRPWQEALEKGIDSIHAAAVFGWQRWHRPLAKPGNAQLFERIRRKG